MIVAPHFITGCFDGVSVEVRLAGCPLCRYRTGCDSVAHLANLLNLLGRPLLVALRTDSMPDRPSICVFCGSSSGSTPAYAQAARRVGELLARHEVSLVYGGGRVGLMGILADAALGAGGRVIGVIPEALATKEIAHDGLTELHVVAGMHERKAPMATLSSAFLTLPGGIGTFEEFFEILSWGALGIHQKPIGVLNIDGLLRPPDRSSGPRHRPGLHPPEVPALAPGLRSGPDTLIADLLAYSPPPVGPRWIKLEET